MTGVDLAHGPARPSWDCAACGRPWPCDPAREDLAVRTGGGAQLAMAGWAYFEEFVSDRPSGPVGEAFDRFIRWTHTARRYPAALGGPRRPAEDSKRAARNRQVLAERLRWPAGALEACKQVEAMFPGWRVWWGRENRAAGFERPEGFTATWEGRRPARRRPVNAVTAEELIVQLRGLQG